MAESMKGLKRTCRCAELNETNIGQTVQLWAGLPRTEIKAEYDSWI